MTQTVHGAYYLSLLVCGDERMKLSRPSSLVVATETGRANDCFRFHPSACSHHHHYIHTHTHTNRGKVIAIETNDSDNSISHIFFLLFFVLSFTGVIFPCTQWTTRVCWFDENNTDRYNEEQNEAHSSSIKRTHTKRRKCAQLKVCK